MKTFRRGSRAPEVKQLQSALLTLGHDLPRWGADGVLGDETYSALAAYDPAYRHGAVITAEQVEAVVDTAAALEAERLTGGWEGAPAPWVHGVDVSGAQSEIDWAAAHAAGDVSFAAVKATEGWGYVSKGWRRHAPAVEQVPAIHRGAFHMAAWWRDGRRKVQAQVDWFSDHVERFYNDGASLAPWVDVEDHHYDTPAERLADLGHGSKLFPPEAKARWTLDFCDRVADRFGAAALYTTQGWYLAALRPVPDVLDELLDRHALIIADYRGDGSTPPPRDAAPPDVDERFGFDRWSGWQWTGRGRITGYVARPHFNKHIDRDVTRDLERLLLPSCRRAA